ncbi:TonB-dependent receptor plug domain-containing protein [Aquimarina longa]|uniref:TonB-dependent receptor plug domain-containing protein n=1 Tax=Aquimarina longa TaxID=1080221 RepID=UPI0007852ABA|nr:TonB-dependent receptor plug domain-containing protein [Aquimarina longa]
MHIRTIILSILTLLSLSFNSIEFRSNNHIEKIYTQTDRSLYFPGETIWFKSYITNTENKISTLSEVMHAELLSPKGTVVNAIKLSINQGYAYGDFEIDNDWVGGIYKVRMYTHWMKNFSTDCYFEKEIVVQKVISPNLLMKLEFEKKAYGSGSEVTAHFEAKNLKNIPLSNQEIKYEVNIKGEKFLSETINTNAKGKQDITFKLPDHLTTTDVILNVLVPHKGSRESISRSVPITLNTIDLQFFPESGTAIIGTENTIAFKAVNKFGKPADISGEIVNEKGEIIKTFDSYHDGMGSFIFTPTSEKYSARITAPFKSDSLIPLPSIDKIGTKFSLKKKKNTYLIDIFSSNTNITKLSVSNSYNEIFTKKVTLSNHKATIRLNKKVLPTGIIKIALHDVHNTIIAERLAFVNKSNQLNIDISLDKEQYETREKVTVKIKTTDQSNTPIPSNISLSIVDNKLVSFADDKQDNISSYLLMSSELKGKIHKPSFYFDPNENKAEIALDYVMLTHGWRKYIKNTITLQNAIFPPDTQATQYGKIVDKNNIPTQSHILIFDQNSEKVTKFETNDKGEFSFKINRNGNLVVLAYTDTGKKLYIQKTKFIHSTSNKDEQKAYDQTKKLDFKQLDIKKPLQKTVKEKAIISDEIEIQLSDDDANLEEVIITSYGLQKRKILSGAVATLVNNTTISTMRIDNIAQLLQGRVSGITTTNTPNLYGNSSNIAIRGANSITGSSQPLLIIDGIPLDLNEKNGATLHNIESSEVEKIHVLKGAAAASLYGSNGINGVVLITTKNQNFNHFYDSKSLNNKKYKNYTAQTFYYHNKINTHTSKKFYIPIYNSKELPLDRNDFRQTIYWNPVIQTDKNGEASFEYYNSDAITSFIITAEGTGYNGLVGRKELKYATKKLLHIDLKTPNYMALNDTIQLSIVASNESNTLISTALNIDLPEELKLISNFKNDSLHIAPNSNQTKTITVVPIKKSQNTTIKISAHSNNYTDYIDKNTIIISPYFPTQTSISGHTNNSYRLHINNLVDGSLKADFSIYTDIVGDVMDGIESLLRQPSGCFEQVSSSTYPNILVLKYLKETGKSNPDIENRAMDFIKTGYKKLAAYETSEDGFEWYGHTPPHEALSAYGLMEFIEMKEVYNKVSEPMINRTINYLLSRKDGKGGFKQNKGKYGFSAAPEHINNAYIVYAITESGTKVAIEEEYNHSYNEALESKDSYRMALMACASWNLNKTENARKLMDEIKKNIEEYGFQKLPTEHTITRSYGNAKEIETTAFTILALLKQGNSEYIISQGIEFMLSKRKYNRFGSTQSTSMALKALIEYTKTQKQKTIPPNSIIELDINGKTIQTELKVNNEGKIVLKNIEQYISEGQQHIEVRFSNADTTFPYLLNITWDSTIPSSSAKCKLELKTEITDAVHSVGENFRMNISVHNKTNQPLPMTTAIIGIPSGTAAQPWQLKEILEQYKADYFEVFDNYLVFYWKEFGASEVKQIQLDLKAEISGSYQAPASTVYLYYTDENKHWITGNKVIIN